MPGGRIAPWPRHVGALEDQGMRQAGEVNKVVLTIPCYEIGCMNTFLAMPQVPSDRPASDVRYLLVIEHDARRNGGTAQGSVRVC